MEPKNMPNYRAPKIRSKIGADPVLSTLVAAITLGISGGHSHCLQVIPVRTGLLTEEDGRSMRHVNLHNHEIAVCAASLVTYSIAVYGFNTGHFIDNNGRLPIQMDTIFASRTSLSELDC